ncbi:hypothetical protein IFM89_000259, partial [Coptis chinensis]
MGIQNMQHHYTAFSNPCAAFISCNHKSYLIDPECFRNLKRQATAYKLHLKKLKKNFRAPNLWTRFEVVGTVNGLICFSPEKFDYICNPITRDYVVAPKSPMIHSTHIGSGFGFDALHNQYKVFRLHYARHSSESGHIVQIYMVILSLNVATEKFSIIQLPSLVNDRLSCYELMVLGEHLCVTVPDFLGRGTWVMKEYGQLGSWVKEYLFTEECFPLLPRMYGHEKMELRNNELVMSRTRSGKLGYYHTGKKVFDYVIVRNVDGGQVGDAHFP